MGHEEVHFVLQVLINGLTHFDVFLGAVLDSDPAQLQVVLLVVEDPHDIWLSTFVDDVYLLRREHGSRNQTQGAMLPLPGIPGAWLSGCMIPGA